MKRLHRLGLLFVAVFAIAMLVAACGGGAGKPVGGGTPVPNDPPGGGVGEGCPASKPCVITTVKQLEGIGQGQWGSKPGDTLEEILENLAESLRGHYVLGGNIDARDTKNWNRGNGFLPIGGKGNPFLGTLDGKGFKITGLHIDGESHVGDYEALFAVIGDGAVIDDVHLETAFIKGRTPNDPSAVW